MTLKKTTAKKAVKKSPSLTSSATTIQQPDDTSKAYDFFRGLQDVHFKNVTRGVSHLFTTDVTGLFQAYLDLLPPAQRQHYTCHACRQFVERYGGLVAIVNGQLEPVAWPEPSNIPEPFRDIAHALRRRVKKAQVTGVFVTHDKTWGIPQNSAPGGVTWTHMHAKPPAMLVAKVSKIKTAGQLAAEKVEEFKMVEAALADFDLATAKTAVTYFQRGGMHGADKVLAGAEWFAKLHEELAAQHFAEAKQNQLWAAIAAAPAGFCHVRSGMLGTVLEAIKEGQSFATIKRSFEKKMEPTKYMRPKVAPTVGNVQRAEKLVAQLGIERSLVRRYATFADVEPFLSWQPAMNLEATPGVFAHLLPSPKPSPKPVQSQLPPQTLTWVKFREQLLPRVRSISFVPGYGRDAYAAITTAVHADAEPILQWDLPGARNPLACYTYSEGTPPERWGLVVGRPVTVTGVWPIPWRNGGVMLLLDNARDSERSQQSCLFPEILKGELHEVRATIEAHSRVTPLKWPTGTHPIGSGASGLLLHPGANRPKVNLVVNIDNALYNVTIDRWD